MTTINLPDTITADNWQDVRIPGTLTLISRQPPVVDWTYEDVTTRITVDTPNRVLIVPDETDPALVTILDLALNRFGQPPSWRTIYRQIRDTAQSAVGVRVDLLTAGQRNALMALLLWDKKAIDNDGMIKPLAQWVVRRDD